MHVNRDGSIDGVCMILHLRDMEADVELHCEWPPGHINARSNANTARGRRWGWTGTGGSSLARPKASELFIRGVGAEDDFAVQGPEKRAQEVAVAIIIQRFGDADPQNGFLLLSLPCCVGRRGTGRGRR